MGLLRRIFHRSSKRLGGALERCHGRDECLQIVKNIFAEERGLVSLVY